MDWRDLHEQSTVVDLHNHAVLKRFLLDRDLSASKTKFLAGLFKRAFWPLSQRSTFPLLDKGGMDIVLSTCYIPEREWLDDQSLVKLALALSPEVRKRVFDPFYFDATVNMIDDMEKQITEYNKKVDKSKNRPVCIVKNNNELSQCLEHKHIAMIHSIEGGHSLQGLDCETSTDMKVKETEILQHLDYFAERGVAYLTLAHFYPNLLAHPVFPYPNYGIKRSNWKHLMGAWDMNVGLSEIGKKVVERMCELKMIIDIAHCTPKARAEVYDIVGDRQNRVISSHSGVFEINPDPYNLHDWELEWFATHGGVLGIIFMNYWISPVDSPLGIKYIERTLEHAMKIGGSDIVGIGTDFDGFTDPPDEITDMSELPRITKYLKCLTGKGGKQKYSDEVIAKFLGGNALRVLKEGWR
ncbi:MAG: hypothetical protein CL833_01890 [Crocinitomicaceae bacterium]|nr:hypothetical protein [Crocinitomicaceae bacterium]